MTVPFSSWFSTAWKLVPVYWSATPYSNWYGCGGKSFSGLPYGFGAGAYFGGGGAYGAGLYGGGGGFALLSILSGPSGRVRTPSCSLWCLPLWWSAAGNADTAPTRATMIRTYGKWIFMTSLNKVCNNNTSFKFILDESSYTYKVNSKCRIFNIWYLLYELRKVILNFSKLIGNWK